MLFRDEDWRIFSLKITRSKDEVAEFTPKISNKDLVGSDECSWVDYIKEMSSGSDDYHDLFIGKISTTQS